MKIKVLKVSGLLLGSLLFISSTAFADDLDVTMDVMDSNSTVDKLMTDIELPTQALENSSEKASDKIGHGLEKANAAREQAALRLESNDHSDAASDNADSAGDNANEAADAAGDNASQAADAAGDNASQAADAASDNASQAAATASENASDRAAEAKANAGL